MSKIVEKINKLLAKANSTTFVEEAAALAEKAHRLMEEHNISQLELGTLDAEDPVNVDHDALSHYRSAHWTQDLIFAAARYYGATAIMNSQYKNKFSYSLIGRESARATTIAMLPFFVKTIRRLGREGYQNGEFESADSGARQVARSFTSRLITIRVERQARERKVEAERKATTGTSLVPVDVIKAKVDQEYPDLVSIKTKTRRGVSNTAWDMAQSISLSDQVSGKEADSVRKLT